MATARRRSAGHATTAPRTPRAVMSERAFYRAMENRQRRIFDVVRELHLADFRTILIESTSVGREDYYCRILIDERELGSERMQKLIGLVNELEGCQLFMRHELGTEKSRLGVWVSHA